MKQIKDDSLCVYKRGSLHIECIVKTNDEGQQVSEFDGKPIAEYCDEREAEVMKFADAWALIQDAQNDLTTGFNEIDSETYNEALNCLPPQAWGRVKGVECFRMCEYYTGDITQHYFTVNKKFYSALKRAGDGMENHVKDLIAQIEENEKEEFWKKK